MTKKVQLAVALSIVQVLAGCGAGSSSMPSAPSPVAPSRPVAPPAPGRFFPNIALSGTVSELVQDRLVPIEKAEVYCEPCGQETHSSAYTDSKGFYTFTGVWGYTFSILVRKDGYQDPPGPVNNGFPSGSGWRTVTINGDTRFDVQLVRK